MKHDEVLKCGDGEECMEDDLECDGREGGV